MYWFQRDKLMKRGAWDISDTSTIKEKIRSVSLDIVRENAIDLTATIELKGIEHYTRQKYKHGQHDIKHQRHDRK
jgi:hypothetical protein